MKVKAPKIKKKKHLMKWNISVVRGKENKNDFKSSGERTWKKSNNIKKKKERKKQGLRILK